VNRFGLGGRISVNWQSGTEVRVSPQRSTQLRTICAILQFDHRQPAAVCRLSASVGPLMRKAPWLRGTRVSVGVDNLFDDRIDVRDRPAPATTPINYQPDLVDPVGRRVEVSLRKLFF
jgi:iron complex outermembrane recepter protein